MMSGMVSLLLVLLCLLPLSTTGQVNRSGVPFIRNFEPAEYNASEQNWSIVQDNRGVIYFGNNDRGILEFDGQTWRTIPIPNNLAVRSLARDTSGTIFVGGVGEIGYLSPDRSGLLQYISLTDSIDLAYRNFSDIWKIHVTGNTVCFATFDRLYILEDGRFEVLEHDQEAGAFFSFLVEDKLYWSTFNKGLLKMEGRNFEIVKNGEFFAKKRITTILPYDKDHFLIGTMSEGLYKYNRNTGEVSDRLFSDKLQNYLKQHSVYDGTLLPGGRFAFATMVGGAVIVSKTGEIEHLLTSDSGLRDAQVTAVYHNPDYGEMPLWLTTFNGISSVEFHNPLASFGESDGLRGLILDVVRFNEKLFVATMSGVFYLDFREDMLPLFRQVPEIRLPVFSFALVTLTGSGERLIAGTQGGIYEIDQALNVSSITDKLPGRLHNCFTLHASEKHPGRVYLGLENDAEYIEFKNNSWSSTPFNLNNQIRSIQEDADGSIWMGTLIDGYIRICFSDNDTIVETFNESHSLPGGLNNLFVSRYKDEIIFKTEEGIFRFDETIPEFIPDERFAGALDMPEWGVTQFASDGRGTIWMAVKKGNDRKIVSLSTDSQQQAYRPDEIPYRPLPRLQCDVIYPDKNNIVWFGISNKLFSYDAERVRNYHEPFNSLIRRVTISQIDSVLFGGTYYTETDQGELTISVVQTSNLIPGLSFSNNRLEFEFTSPYYDRHEETLFSWYLEGEDVGWSSWSGETRVQYTYLREGQYKFNVKALNIYGIESNVASYEFYINPPWHRTMGAYSGYVILMSLFIYSIVVLNSRRLKKEKIVLEGIVKERTAEVVKQKEEIEIKSDKIAEQHRDIKASIEYAQRIQNAVLPPDEYVQELIPERFILFLPRDIVSGDFYWLTKLDKRIITVAADCTGHGVPGGFMSMLGISFLNEIVNKSRRDISASEILDLLRSQVIESLHQTGRRGEAQDGMDISLCIFDYENRSLEYAGANNPLILIRDNELIEVRGDKMPIGIHDRARQPFTNHILNIQNEDVVYIFSDGYQDQFGGPKGKKFMIKRFRQLLIDIHQKPMCQQRDILLKRLVEWQGAHERVDDIIVIGIKIENL